MTQTIFVNLPVADLARARAFYAALGFGLDERFGDDGTACVVVSDSIFLMLLTRERFAGFAPRPVGEPARETTVLVALSREGRAAVDAATARVLAVADAHRALQRSPDLRRVRLSDLLDELAAGTAVQHPGTDLRTDAAEALTLDAERAIPLALVLAELVEGAVRRAAGARVAPEPMRLSARREGGAVLVELTDAGAAAEEGEAPGLGEKVVRVLTRQIGAVLETERLPRGRLRTALSLPEEPAKPTED